MTGFDWVLLGFTGFYWVLLGFTGFYWVLSGFTGLYWVLLGYTGFYWVLLGLTGLYWVYTGFYWVLLGFTGFYWIFTDDFDGGQTLADALDLLEGGAPGGEGDGAEAAVGAFQRRVLAAEQDRLVGAGRSVEQQLALVQLGAPRLERSLDVLFDVDEEKTTVSRNGGHVEQKREGTSAKAASL